MFALSGAHRSGKTTTAMDVAARLKIPFHESGVTRIMREIGVNPVSDLPMEERLRAQEHLLMRYCEEVRAIREPFITDRSPLDFVGYTLAEVTMHNTDLELGNEIVGYVDRCMQAADELLDTIFVLRPLPVFQADPTKPPPNLAYQELHQIIVEGSLYRFGGKASILLTEVREERAEILSKRIVDAIRRCEEESASRLLH